MKLNKLLKKKDWYYINPDITDENFPEPNKIQTEGWKLIKMDKSFSSQEALDKIKAEGCRPANCFELITWANKHREKEIPKGQWSSVLAFGQLYSMTKDYFKVPRVCAYSDGDFGFDLGYFVIGWSDNFVLLAFCDNNLDTGKLETSYYSQGLEEGKAMIGKQKRIAFQKGYDEGKADVLKAVEEKIIKMDLFPSVEDHEKLKDFNDSFVGFGYGQAWVIGRVLKALHSLQGETGEEIKN